MKPLDLAQAIAFSEALQRTLTTIHHQGDLGPLAYTIALKLREMGIPVTRLQLPISALFGFKHPFFAGIILTWTVHDGVQVALRERSELITGNSIETLKKSPYAPLIFEHKSFVRARPRLDDDRQMIVSLAQRGYTDYIAFTIPLPDGALQVMSIATDSSHGFEEGIDELLLLIRPILSVPIFAAYQMNATRQIAITYLGQHAGSRVLDGAFYRGNYEQLSTLILFADIRNFTSLSEQVGARKVIEYVNLAFERLNLALKPCGGEILKFIGDAALMIFPRLDIDLSKRIASDHSSVSLQFLDIFTQLKLAISEIRQIEVEGASYLDLGVGLHVGDVYYGNIGAKDRLDFTVIGPAVNLASRLEGLTKTLSSTILFSEEVYQYLANDEQASLSLVEFPPQRVKGISKRIKVWGATI